MKYIIALFCFITVVSVQHLQAQTRTEETVTTTDSTGKSVVQRVVKVSRTENVSPVENMIIINPLKFFLYYNLSYYRKITPGLVIGGGLQIPTIEGLGGWGVNLEARLHPSVKAPKGFYFAPNFSYNRLTTDQNVYEFDPNTGQQIIVGVSTVGVSSTSIGALIGWQWFPSDEFAIGLGIGADYYMLSDVNRTSAYSFRSVDGFVPALRFDIGYAW
jgi:hypothetical protein